MKDAVGRRLVAVMPHPDDEAYSVAGTLAQCARSGADVTLITATAGESGWLSPVVARALPETPVAAIRRAELERACATIGIAPPAYLGWPDGAVADVDQTKAAAQLQARLRELDPDVVITLASDGIYGHRDHVAVTELVGRATDCRVLWATFPRGLLAPLARWFRSNKPELVAADLDIDGLGDSDFDLTIPLDDDLAHIKRRAIASHRSQLLREDPLEFLLPGFVDRVCREEWFLHAGGSPLPSGADSVFAGL